ncbi:MAG TPA: 2-dehydropantoate 2-reductase [Acetobacteraceae bacterium]|jgi:2-dehydropantoate 2-reductase|nr:2-dehydropantoate 2-reductase [Acetobacteraceae bacterium]
MKVCVFGAGAIGGHLAVRLARGGADVSVVARGAQLAAIQRNGLKVIASDGEFDARVRASTDPADLGPQDAVLVTVKAPALPSVAASIAPLLSADTPVAFVMNGIPWCYFHGIGGELEGRRLPKIDPGDALWRTVGPDRAIAGVVYAASTVIRPGVIELENPSSRVVLGEMDGRVSQRVQSITAHIYGGGMKADVTPAVRDEIWNKLLGNLATGSLAVLTQTTIRRIYQEDVCVATARRIMHEAAAIAVAVGAKPDLDHEKRIAHGRGLDHKSSILQDLELGRPMEIDGIFDAPLEMARAAGVRAPTLEMVVGLMKVRAREAGLYAG